MQAHHIPIELKVLRQWLCYELIWNEKRQQYDKPPKSPHDGKAGSSTDSQTWGTFEEAIAGAAKHHLEGVGFVFTEQDPYCGVDLDEMIGLDHRVGHFASMTTPKMSDSISAGVASREQPRHP